MQASPFRATATSVALAALVGTTLLTGCDDSGSEGGSTPTSSASSTTSAPSSPPASSTSASPTSSALGPGLPGVPANARANTEAAAIAFTKHYINQVNHTRMAPKTGVIEPFGLPGCKSCTAFAGSIQYLKENGERYSAPLLLVSRATRITGESGMVIQVGFNATTVPVIGRDGTTSRTQRASADYVAVYFLRWAADGWRVKEIKEAA
ncbi:DUF6318 family protein [Luteipulveratus mongoliensis]|uniref:DUF6318 family protein n=1 Tax=Luteipulveratus mongoliensis TaxID=571913 RepID=UPI00069827C1|nr:DUF6318 family protein [Luteipulveratus mongoliensis]